MAPFRQVNGQTTHFNSTRIIEAFIIAIATAIVTTAITTYVLTKVLQIKVDNLEITVQKELLEVKTQTANLEAKVDAKFEKIFSDLYSPNSNRKSQTGQVSLPIVPASFTIEDTTNGK